MPGPLPGEKPTGSQREETTPPVFSRLPRVLIPSAAAPRPHRVHILGFTAAMDALMAARISRSARRAALPVPRRSPRNCLSASSSPPPGRKSATATICWKGVRPCAVTCSPPCPGGSKASSPTPTGCPASARRTRRLRGPAPHSTSWTSWPPGCTPLPAKAFPRFPPPRPPDGAEPPAAEGIPRIRQSRPTAVPRGGQSRCRAVIASLSDRPGFSPGTG
jgi:hypothetical protein